MSFPKDFLWGAASASAQIEGAWDQDGRTPSIWDVKMEGKIANDDTCHITCDHYHRYKDDVALMRTIGLKAYRFSVSWSRVLPARGVVNPKGIEFYQSLVRELKAAGIEPMVTLFHSDMPMWVFEDGGWNSERTVTDFTDFAELMVKSLPEVTYWFTMNEPQCFAPDFIELAPGSDEKQVIRVILLSHGEAVSRMRTAANHPLKIGHVIMGIAMEPVPGAVTEEFAYNRTFSDEAGIRGMGWWTDPMLLGRVPEPLKDVISEADIKRINQPLDLFCANVYGSANFMRRPGRPNPLTWPGMPVSHIRMPITPDILYWFARMAYKRYGLPVLFTENGFSNIDFVMRDGKVHDPQRIDYIATYLAGLKRAVEEGIPMEGYLYWSIMDNFEWLYGYDMRFGLIHIDYRTQKRTLKDSAYYYANVIRTNGEEL